MQFWLLACCVMVASSKIASSRRRYRHLVVISMFGHVWVCLGSDSTDPSQRYNMNKLLPLETWISSSPKIFVTLSVTLSVTDTGSSSPPPKSLLFYYIWKIQNLYVICHHSLILREYIVGFNKFDWNCGKYFGKGLSLSLSKWLTPMFSKTILIHRLFDSKFGNKFINLISFHLLLFLLPLSL
jgi:hypothetical protein